MAVAPRKKAAQTYANFQPSWGKATQPGATAAQGASATQKGLAGGPASPVAGPPPSPFLTPDDLASQAVEEADWSRYFSGIENQTRQMEIDSNSALAANEQAHGHNVEANDWNAAARGLGQSSIKQQDRAKIIQAFERNQGTIRDKLAAQKSFTSTERQNYETKVQPFIAAKWAAKAQQNAAEAAARAAEASAAGGGGGSPAAASRPSAAAAGYRNVVKNGKFYHVYGDGSKASDWRYIRPAS